MPEPRSPYPSDLSDTEWSLLEPLLESPERRGRPPKWPARRVADAVFYLLGSGCAKPTTGFARRCARRKDARGTRAER
jgi:hypothetical protein